MGNRHDGFCLQDEMGWSWWSALKCLAEQKLSAGAAPHINAVDAWRSVYIDADTERHVLWPDGKPDSASHAEQKIVVTNVSGGSWPSRFLRKLRSKKFPVPDEVAEVLDQMVTDFGARAGESDALQVGSLRGLSDELGRLLDALGVERSEEAVTLLMESYSQDDRFDDDPEIQCLCHAWLTTTYAIQNGEPMWLVK